jgi:hypothetical protein
MIRAGGTVKKGLMTGSFRGLATLLAALALAGCSRPSGHAPAAQGTGTGPAVETEANATAASGQAISDQPPMPDPASDKRPDKVKLADFLSRIEAGQASLAAADATVIRNARTALQAGDERAARIALAGYRAEVVRELTALPQPPRLAGCYATAKGPADSVAGGVAAMLADRRDKADTAVGTGARPMALADFGPLATTIAEPAPADLLKTEVAQARSAPPACLEARARAARGRPPIRGQTFETAARAPERAPAPVSQPAQQPSPTAQPRKPDLLDRFRRAFQ